MYLFQTFPFIFVLTTRKTQACYSHIFEYIESNICSLKAKSFMTDFELAMRNALKKLYPDAEHNTCWFHLCQAAQKNAEKCREFIKLIMKNEEARVIYKKILGLPLLPANLIKDAFIKLKADALSKFGKTFLKFLTYFEEQGIEKVTH